MQKEAKARILINDLLRRKVSPADIKALNGWRDVIPEYVKDYVPLNTFAA